MNGEADRESFARACGLDGPLRLGVQAPERLDEIVRDLPGPFVVVGRDASADLVLDHPAVGRRHALLHVVAGRIFAMALGGRGGLTWDGQRCDAGWVGRGQTVGVGPFRIRAVLEEATGDRSSVLPTSRAFSRPGIADLALEFAGPDPVAGTWQVSRAVVLVGSSQRCRIQLPGPGVSPVHAAIVRTEGGAWLVDLLAPGGVEVGGRPARFGLLRNGPILVGPHEIGVRLGRVALPAQEIRHPALPPAHTLLDRASGVDPNLLAILGEFGRMQDRMTDQFQQALMTMFQLFSGMHQEQMTLIRQELAQLHRLTEEQQVIASRLAATPRPAPEIRPMLTHERTAPTVARGTPPSPRSPEPFAMGQDVHVVLSDRLASLGEERQNLWRKLMASLLKPPPGDLSP